MKLAQILSAYKPWLVVLMLAICPPAAWAANCGGGAVCRCGDTVTTNYVMPGDLACPIGHGLRVASGRTLNCDGRSLTGINEPGTYGIYLDGTTGGYVVNCNVYRFERGIRLNTAFDNTLQNSVTALNGIRNTNLAGGYGIDFAGGASRNVLLNVSSIANADEGVHVGTNANDNIVYQGEFCGNFRENLYFLDNRDNVVHSVVAGHSCYGFTSGSNAVYQRDIRHNHFLWNQFRERSFHVTGDSAGTVLYNNTFTGGAVYKETCYALTGACPYLTIKVP